MKHFVLDTNVLLHSPNCLRQFGENTVVVPVDVIEELDKFKSRNDELGHNARAVIRIIDKARVEGCVNHIRASCETPEIGSKYTGSVKSVKDFGAFIEILPGVEGMCHISELAEGFVSKVTDVANVGDEIEVVVINVDDRGKIKLSHKQTLASTEA